MQNWYKEIRDIVNKATEKEQYIVLVKVVKILVKEMVEIGEVLVEETKKYQKKEGMKVKLEDIPDISYYVSKTKDPFMKFRMIKKFCSETGIIFNDIVGISVAYRYSDEKDLDKFLNQNDVIRSLKYCNKISKN